MLSTPLYLYQCPSVPALLAHLTAIRPYLPGSKWEGRLVFVRDVVIMENGILSYRVVLLTGPPLKITSFLKSQVQEFLGL